MRSSTIATKGNLATIGRAAAIADLGWIKVGGFVAWVLWIAVHIFFLIGFRNRFIVMFKWAWAYFASQRGARLITGDLFRDRAPAAPPVAESDDAVSSGSRQSGG